MRNMYTIFKWCDYFSSLWEDTACNLDEMDILDVIYRVRFRKIFVMGFNEAA